MWKWTNPKMLLDRYRGSAGTLEHIFWCYNLRVLRLDVGQGQSLVFKPLGIPLLGPKSGRYFTC